MISNKSHILISRVHYERVQENSNSFSFHSSSSSSHRLLLHLLSLLWESFKVAQQYLQDCKAILGKHLIGFEQGFERVRESKVVQDW